MKSLVQFIKESQYPWLKFELKSTDKLTEYYYDEQFRVARKVMNMIGYKSTSKKNSKTELPFYFDETSCVSILNNDVISDNVFNKDAITIQELADLIKEYIDKNLSDINSKTSVEVTKVEDKVATVDDLKAVSKDTYETLSGVFDNLIIGKKGGLSADYKSSSDTYKLSFTEKNDVLTVRSSKNNGTPSPIAKGGDINKVIANVLAKLKKWGIDLEQK